MALGPAAPPRRGTGEPGGRRSQGDRRGPVHRRHRDAPPAWYTQCSSVPRSPAADHRRVDDRVGGTRPGGPPGVLGVLTPMNCPRLNPPPADFSETWPVERRPPLSDLSVHHVGQHVAVVIADSFENATYAASQFTLDYRQVATDDDAAVRSGSYWPDHWVEVADEKLQDRRGELTEPTVPVSVSGQYTTSATVPYPLELSATIARWDGDRLTVYDSTRWISGEKRLLAHCLDLPEPSVRVISPLVGGAFGAKVFLWSHVLLCAVAAREVGRPVKLVLTREQMFDTAGYRPPRTEQEVTLLADADGGNLQHRTPHGHRNLPGRGFL